MLQVWQWAKAKYHRYKHSLEFSIYNFCRWRKSKLTDEVLEQLSSILSLYSYDYVINTGEDETIEESLGGKYQVTDAELYTVWIPSVTPIMISVAIVTIYELLVQNYTKIFYKFNLAIGGTPAMLLDIITVLRCWFRHTWNNNHSEIYHTDHATSYHVPAAGASRWADI